MRRPPVAILMASYGPSICAAWRDALARPFLALLYAVVVREAKGLQVVGGIEQGFVALVLGDVVHDCSRLGSAVFEAHSAKRLARKVDAPDLAPASGVVEVLP